MTSEQFNDNKENLKDDKNLNIDRGQNKPISLERFIRDWSEMKTILGQSFDDLFNLEGIPLWWFYRRFFTFHVMPKYLNTFNALTERRSLSVKEKTSLMLHATLLKKLLILNEKRKINFFKKGKTGPEKEEKNQSSQSIQTNQNNQISQNNQSSQSIQTNQNKNLPENKKVLFLSYSDHISPEGKLFRMHEVVKKISREKKHREIIIFADSLSSKKYHQLSVLENLPFNSKVIYQYYDEKLSAKADREARSLFRKWCGISDQDKEKIFDNGGFSLWPYLKYSLHFFFSEEFFYLLILYFEIFKKILLEENVGAIVLTSQSGFFEKTLLAASKKLDLPVIQIQHGIGSGDVDTTYATKRLVFSESHKQQLIESGVAEEDIFIIGPLIFDDIINNFCQNKDWEKEETNGDSFYKILFATSPFVEESYFTKKYYFKIVENIIKAVSEMENIHLTMKLHPREKYLKEYQSIIDKIGFDRVTIINKADRKKFYRVMNQCDAFVNFGSTTAIEAMIMNKPVVTVDMGKYKFKELTCGIVRESDAALTVHYDGDIKKAIQDALQDDDLFKLRRKSFLEKYCFKVDGKAYDRAAECIYNLLLK